MISLVAACSRNRVIGINGHLPWHIPADLKRFRCLTEGHTVLMGRKTFDSLPPTKRPLPNRRNIVLSTRLGYRPDEGAIGCSSMSEALEEAGPNCFVIGGEAVFRIALPLATRIYLTEVDCYCEGDAFFPALGKEWVSAEESFYEPSTCEEYRVVFKTYVRTA